MKLRNAIAICLMAGLVWTAFADWGSTSEENTMQKDNDSAKQVSQQNLPCNWEGWSKTHPEVECGRLPCDQYGQVFKMKCTAGKVEEVKLETVCVACREYSAP